MENTRQEKLGKQLQKDIAEILQKEHSDILRGILVTVSEVRLSVDLSYAKVFLSVFPYQKTEEIMGIIQERTHAIRGAVGKRLRFTVKNIPELQFMADSSLEYMENIDALLKK